MKLLSPRDELGLSVTTRLEAKPCWCIGAGADSNFGPALMWISSYLS